MQRRPRPNHRLRRPGLYRLQNLCNRNTQGTIRVRRAQGAHRVRGAALVGALVGAIVGGGVGTGATLLLKDDGNRQVTVTQGSTAVQQVRTGEPAPALTKRSDIHALIAKVEPAVVSINVEVTQDTPFGSQEGKAAGTGFIISSDGVIVTNNHVVETARSVKVQFQDGSSVDAKVLGTDKYNDLGVIKVDKKDLPTLKLGNSSDMRVGDDVVAIGNALALEGGFSVTRESSRDSTGAFRPMRMYVCRGCCRLMRLLIRVTAEGHSSTLQARSLGSTPRSRRRAKVRTLVLRSQLTRQSGSSASSRKEPFPIPPISVCGPPTPQTILVH